MTTFLRRIVGAALLDARTYEDVEAHQSAGAPPSSRCANGVGWMLSLLVAVLIGVFFRPHLLAQWKAVARVR